MDDPTTQPAHTQHHQAAAGTSVRCAVLTVSDTRNSTTDRSGDAIERLLREAGHTTVRREIIRDEPTDITRILHLWLPDPQIDAIITTGGTGISHRDSTPEVVRGLMDIELRGFGELFRMLSYEEVGAAAMMSRAVGGLVRGDNGKPHGTFLFTLPGSVNAVETAMTQLLGPQLGHMVFERRKETAGQG